MSRVDDFRVAMQGRMVFASSAWGYDLFYDFQEMLMYRDVIGIEEIETLMDEATEAIKTRMDRAADAIGWRTYQLGRVDAISEKGQRFKWELDAGAQHCETCLELAAGGPYTIDTLPGIPADADTICDGGCRCNLVEVAA